MKRLILISILFAGAFAQAQGSGAMKVKVGTQAKPAAAATGASPFQFLEQGQNDTLLAFPAEFLREAVNEHGETLLIKAIVDEKIEIAEKLIPKSNLAALDKVGNDALLYAVTGGQTSLVAKLLKAGAKTDRLYDEARENIAFEAARGGDVKLLTLLLKHDPKLVSGKNKAGQGLIEAANAAAQSETTLLLAKDVGARRALSAEGKTALLKDLARQKKNSRAGEIRQLLESAK
ncbi:MAG: hypothetical protein KF767_07745 [Bdellovibrionaceae bacterium]|nr:hypothetical protein [Pseudobdellovibrionaceae bacterium]